jgi:hypothetical protein
MAAKLHNPRIEKMMFHTFGHFKVTIEYHKTKDVFCVMRILGIQQDFKIKQRTSNFLAIA